MFLRERKPREYQGTTIYMLKHENTKIEKYLDYIVRNIENYVQQRGVMPEKLKLGRKNLSRIMKYNKNLIEEKEDKLYTFGVEIEV